MDWNLTLCTGMDMKRIIARLGNMKKEADWVVYPERDAKTITIQSDHRICRFDRTTGVGFLSKHKTNYSSFADLMPFAGAMEVVVSAEVIAAAIEAQPHSGDAIGSCVRIA